MIDRIGRFRGRPTQGVIKPTKNGFPQFIVQLDATEYFNEDTGEWIEWSEYNQSITAFLVLFNATKALLNYEQVMKAFAWDGQDMADLQSDDYGDLQVSFEVEENEYQGNVSLRVNWIDAYEAEPRGGSLTPMDSGDLKALNAQYKQFMKAAPKAKPTKGTGKNVKKAAAPPAPKAAAPPPPPAPAPTPDASDTTRESAWFAVNMAMDGKTDTQTITQAWVKGVAEVSQSAGMAEDNFTGTEWDAVSQTVLDMLSV
jgi:hypothetical protein